MGRPKNSFSTQYVKMEDLMKRFRPDECVAVGSAFLKKYHLFDIKPKILPQIKEIDLTKEE